MNDSVEQDHPWTLENVQQLQELAREKAPAMPRGVRSSSNARSTVTVRSLTPEK